MLYTYQFLTHDYFSSLKITLKANEINTPVGFTNINIAKIDIKAILDNMIVKFIYDEHK